MFENEGSEIETQSDAIEETSSESPSNESEGQVDAAKAESTETTNEKPTDGPFHEHPRFKELVEQKNQAIAAQKALEERYHQLEGRLTQLSQPTKPAQAEKDDLIEDLKQIDPRLAARLEQATKLMPTVESLTQQLKQYQDQQVRTQAVNQIQTLHDTNKVSPEMRNFINNQLDLMAMRGEIKELKDIPTSYKAVHDAFKKYEDAIKRSERESYVTQKKADAKTPTSQPKGKPATPANQKFSYSKDPEVAKAQVVARYLKSTKAESEI